MSAVRQQPQRPAAGMRFANKTIVITGAPAGIGTATALQLGTERTSFVPGDVRQRRTAEEVIGRALKRPGNIRALVNKAAIDHTGDLIDTPIDEVRALFDVNVFGALHMLQVAAEAMVSHGTGARSSTSPPASRRSASQVWCSTVPPKAPC